MLQRWWTALQGRVRRGSGAGSGAGDHASGATPQDFVAEREEARHAHMSDADRAWEAASRQRDRDRQTQSDTPADPGQSAERQDH